MCFLKAGPASPLARTLYIKMLENEILELVSRESGVPISKISLNSTLLGDIGLDGDDAWEVFESCHEKHGLDLTNFEFQRHFRNEPCFKGFIYLFRKLKHKDEHIAAKKEAITVARLIESCESGKWNQNV